MSAYHSPSRSRQAPQAGRIRTELPPGLGGNAGEGPKGWRRLSRRERRQLLRGRQVLSRRELAGVVKGSLLEMIQQAGLVWIHDRLEAEADEVCGAPKGKHSPHRQGKRHGHDTGTAVLGGVKVSLLRPRVRSMDGKKELALPTYEAIQDEGTLSETVLVQALKGVAMRGYDGAVRTALQLPGEVPVSHTAKGTASRRFVAETGALLAGVLSRPLTERYRAVFLDGLQLGAHHVIAAVGVTEAGEKRVLGLWEGEAENRVVCQALLENLTRRGLSAERGLLVVIDGSKALAAAVRAVWGRHAVIQRCIVHSVSRSMEAVGLGKEGRPAA